MVNKLHYGLCSRYPPLCWNFRIDGINIMSRGISGDEQVIKLANTTNRGRECLPF